MIRWSRQDFFLVKKEDAILAQRETLSTDKVNPEENFFTLRTQLRKTIYAAVDCARSAGSSQRTETSFDTPGSCIVTP